MLRQFSTPQFRRFLVSGGVAAAVNLGSRAFYDLWMSYSLAIVLAYVTGMATAFALNRRFVFQSSTSEWSTSAGRFVIVNCLGLAQTWAVSLLMTSFVLPLLHVDRFRAGIAHFVGVAAPVFTSYAAHRLWTFAETDRAPESPRT